MSREQTLVTEQNEAATFFCGGSRNFARFIDLCDEVFVLHGTKEDIPEPASGLMRRFPSRTLPTRSSITGGWSTGVAEEPRPIGVPTVPDPR